MGSVNKAILVGNLGRDAEVTASAVSFTSKEGTKPAPAEIGPISAKGSHLMRSRIASNGSKTAGRRSYSTRTLSIAFSASASVRAATAATPSPKDGQRRTPSMSASARR